MKFFFVASLAAVLAVAQGCSSDSVKRVTFESLQNYSRQECLKDPAADCPERESYDDYQQKREEAKSED
jgi:hypothetical protein